MLIRDCLVDRKPNSPNRLWQKSLVCWWNEIETNLYDWPLDRCVRIFLPWFHIDPTKMYWIAKLLEHILQKVFVAHRNATRTDYKFAALWMSFKSFQQFVETATMEIRMVDFSMVINTKRKKTYESSAFVVWTFWNPCCASNESNIVVFESNILPGRSSLPGSVNSSPVEIIVMHTWSCGRSSHCLPTPAINDLYGTMSGKWSDGNSLSPMAKSHPMGLKINDIKLK